MIYAAEYDVMNALLAYLTEERRRLRGRGFSIIESATGPAPLPAV